MKTDDITEKEGTVNINLITEAQQKLSQAISLLEKADITSQETNSIIKQLKSLSGYEYPTDIGIEGVYSYSCDDWIEDIIRIVDENDPNSFPQC